MIFEFFVLWGFWWWALLALIIVADIFFLENDNGTGATISLIIFGAVMIFLGDWNPFPWMAANPLETVGIVLGYFVAGTIWSVIKWYFYCLNIRDRYNELKDEFFKEHGITGNKLPMTLKKEWKNHTDWVRGLGRGKDIPPSAAKNKGKILTWMTHWPFSAIWTLLNDPIRRVFIWIYKYMASGLQKISNRLFASIIVEFDEGDEDDADDDFEPATRFEH